MSFLGKALEVSTGQVVGHIFGLVAGIIMARQLGPAAIGQFEILKSFQSITVTIFAVGMGNSIIYFINNKNYNIASLLSSTFVFTLTMGILLFGISMLFLIKFPWYFGELSLSMIAIYSIGSCFLLILLNYKTILTAKFKSRELIVVDQLPRIVIFLVAFSTILTQFNNINIYLLGLTLGYLSSLYFLRKYTTEYSKKTAAQSKTILKQILAYGAKLSLNDILQITIFSLPIFLIQHLSSHRFTDTGYYSRAIAISGLISLIPQTVGPLVYARFATLEENKLVKKTEYALRLNFSVNLLFSLFVIVFAEVIVTLLYGKNFQPATGSIRLLSISVIFMGMTNICLSMLSSQGKASLTNLVLFVNLILLLILAFFGIPILGISGAAIATLVSQVLTSLLAFFICLKNYDISYQESFFLKKTEISDIFKKSASLLLPK